MQVIDIAATTRAAHLSNEDQAVNDFHDILRAGYKVVMKRFIGLAGCGKNLSGL